MCTKLKISIKSLALHSVWIHFLCIAARVIHASRNVIMMNFSCIDCGQLRTSILRIMSYVSCDHFPSGMLCYILGTA